MIGLRKSAYVMLMVGVLAIPTVSSAENAGDETQASSLHINRVRGPCNRTCLRLLADDYLEAMITKDQARLRWSTKTKYTENGMELRVGEGLWASASAPGRYRQHFVDPISGQIGVIATIIEAGAPVLLGLRLKVVNHRITEVEHIVARSQFGYTGAAALEERGSPPSIFSEQVPTEDRASRAELAEAAHRYFDAVEQSSGEVARFVPETVRIENGVQTCGPRNDEAGGQALVTGSGSGSSEMMRRACAGQLDTGLFSYITEARDRRVEIVDEETGTVLAFVIFAHPGHVRAAELPDQPRVEMSPAAQRPFDTQIAEAFKVRSGRIQQIEAVINTAAFGIPSGWERR